MTRTLEELDLAVIALEARVTTLETKVGNLQQAGQNLAGRVGTLEAGGQNLNGRVNALEEGLPNIVRIIQQARKALKLNASMPDPAIRGGRVKKLRVRGQLVSRPVARGSIGD